LTEHRLESEDQNAVAAAINSTVPYSLFTHVLTTLEVVEMGKVSSLNLKGATWH